MSVRHLLRFSTLLGTSMAFAGISLVPGGSAFAQSATSQLTDASVLPRRTLGVRLVTSWSRFDELIGAGGMRNLAASFNVDSLAGGQINQLGYTQSLIQTLSGVSAFRVTAGDLVAAANSRVLTAPLILEYGLTSKLSLALVVPLVETRTTLGAQLNPHPGSANVGPNPAITSGDYSTNAALIQSFRSAATGLQTKLTQCQTAPSAAGCPTLLAQQAAAQQLIASSGTFANALEELYGTGSSHSGMSFVPIGGSAAQTAIAGRIQSFVQQYQAFGATAPAGSVRAAGGPAANAYLNAILQRAGYDTLQSPDRSSIGDITLGATYQLANTFDTTRATGGLRYRIAVNAAGRIGTGQVADARRLFDNSTGTGQPGLILGAAADIAISSRAIVSGVGSYTMNFGSTSGGPVNPNYAAFPLTLRVGSSRSAGDVTMLSLVPRYRVAGYFSVFGNYTLVHAAPDTYASVVPPGIFLPSSLVLPGGVANPAVAATAQQAGFGVSYSTLAGGERNPGRIPFEVSFRHLETLSASGGPVPKTFEDQLQLRVFFR